MPNRSATHTIKGYFYQFDFTIYQLLNQSDENNIITIEGIEDIDVTTSDGTTAIQCKYYESQEYNHSIIKKTIQQMLLHFKQLKNNSQPTIKYLLYGFFNDGHNKLSIPFDINFLKNNFLTTIENRIIYEFHIVHNISDIELLEFLDLLKININAKEYKQQYNETIDLFQKQFNCDIKDAEYHYYNNALSEIHRISIEHSDYNRKITKKEFLKKIDNKTFLFNKWFLDLKKKNEYFIYIKNKYFTILNREPYERFFLIDSKNYNNLSDLKELISLISKKFSNLKRRELQTYCPYIFIKIDKSDLIKIKIDLQKENFIFIDGYAFQDSNFYPESIIKQANYNNQIKIKFINELSQIDKIFEIDNKRKEIYLFYFDSIFYETNNNLVKQLNIQIKDLSDIKEII